MKAIVVAKAFIGMSEPECGDYISNLKLQKLLYYAQGFHIALYGKPFFEEKVVAWQYGPVVIEIYNEYKKYRSGVIDKERISKEDYDLSELTEDQFDLLREVYDVYGQFSALKLMNMTHAESPWKDTKINDEITIDKLEKYFKELLIV